MIEFLSTLPHCALFGRPMLAGLHLIGDGMIFFAYMAIPVAIEIVRRLRGIHFNALAALFAMFIFSCGMGHLFDIAAMTTGATEWYWVRGVNDFVTGAISISTAIYAFKLIPILMEIPTPEQHAFNLERIEIMEELERWRQTGKPRVVK